MFGQLQSSAQLFLDFFFPAYEMLLIRHDEPSIFLLRLTTSQIAVMVFDLLFNFYAYGITKNEKMSLVSIV